MSLVPVRFQGTERTLSGSCVRQLRGPGHTQFYSVSLAEHTGSETPSVAAAGAKETTNQVNLTWTASSIRSLGTKLPSYACLCAVGAKVQSYLWRVACAVNISAALAAQTRHLGRSGTIATLRPPAGPVDKCLLGPWPPRSCPGVLSCSQRSAGSDSVKAPLSFPGLGRGAGLSVSVAGKSVSTDVCGAGCSAGRRGCLLCHPGAGGGHVCAPHSLSPYCLIFSPALAAVELTEFSISLVVY
ncbi:uncharacterized protein LOC123632163 [Lemur catta]|uniref:uncharacterized protein LOC123632163 n=1 Tax=Lemur catta TaxID=9447 RepID=UPI001E26BEF0|nr:uncharacterized protein LOC123632163 [Lemur catta]